MCVYTAIALCFPAWLLIVCVVKKPSAQYPNTEDLPVVSHSFVVGRSYPLSSHPLLSLSLPHSFPPSPPLHRGTEEHAGLVDKVDIINSTLGKALGGAAGGYTTGSKELISLLRQRSRPYLFSNSLPPAVVAAASKVGHHPASLIHCIM